MTIAFLKNADWAKRSSRFYALGTSFAIGALISWVQALNKSWWAIPFSGIEIANDATVANSLGVMAATLGWGALVAMLLAAACRRDASSQKMLGFAGLACFIGWDAGWRMMTYTHSFFGAW